VRLKQMRAFARRRGLHESQNSGSLLCQCRGERAGKTMSQTEVPHHVGPDDGSNQLARHRFVLWCPGESASNWKSRQGIRKMRELIVDTQYT